MLIIWQLSHLFSILQLLKSSKSVLSLRILPIRKYLRRSHHLPKTLATSAKAPRAKLNRSRKLPFLSILSHKYQYYSRNPSKSWVVWLRKNILIWAQEKRATSRKSIIKKIMDRLGEPSKNLIHSIFIGMVMTIKSRDQWLYQFKSKTNIRIPSLSSRGNSLERIGYPRKLAPSIHRIPAKNLTRRIPARQAFSTSIAPPHLPWKGGNAEWPLLGSTTKRAGRLCFTLTPPTQTTCRMR